MINWLPLPILLALLARKLNNPTASKNLEINVKERNKTIILNGFVELFWINKFSMFPAVLILKSKINIAPIVVINQ